MMTSKHDDEQLFASLLQSQDLTRLRARLAERAEQEGLLDIAYRIVDSPVGPLLLAATDAGVLRVAFTVQDHDAVLQGLADTVSPRVLHAPGRLDPAARQLDEYFDGRTADLRPAAGLAAGQGIPPRGARPSHRHRLRPHRELRPGRGRLPGRPRAVRAVGTACATNPIPVVVPCHRVVRSDGSAGGYVGGLEAKNRCCRWSPRHDGCTGRPGRHGRLDRHSPRRSTAPAARCYRAC